MILHTHTHTCADTDTTHASNLPEMRFTSIIMDSLSSHQRDNLEEFLGQLFAILIIASCLILYGPRLKGHGIISTIYA